MQGPFWIDPNDDSKLFPPVELALEEPDGLLAAGGDLSPERIVAAYQNGIFPWYSEDQPILWWSPNPRAVIFPDELHISRSLAKTLRRNQFRVSLDTEFEAVLKACAAPRADELGTWITDDMHKAYTRLHQLGIAHSVEVWQDEELVGGLYGLSLGRVFFGESMFSRVTDASKVALVKFTEQLQAWGYALIDCQVSSPHISSLGASNIPRAEFVSLLKQWAQTIEPHPDWRFDDQDGPNTETGRS